MAVPAFARSHVNPVFAVDTVAAATVAKIYIYARGISSGEMAYLIGRVKADGSVEDGVFVDLLQTFTAKEAQFGASNPTTELDTDTNSPLEGYVRAVIDLVAQD